MFKAITFCSALLAAAQAVTFQGELNRQQVLAQVADGGSCCCQALPCMPTCQQECKPEKAPLPPVIVEELPPQIQDTILNLDVIITHILHEIRPSIPPTVPIPEPRDPAEEHKFVQTTITPIVLELLVNDIVPALPVCTYPSGQQFYLDAASGPNPNATLPDMNALLSGSLEEAISALSGNVNAHAQEALDNLDPASIISDLMITDAAGDHAVEVIVAGEHTRQEWVDDEDWKNSTGGSTSMVGGDLQDYATDAIEDALADKATELTNEANAE